jgi:dihydroorotase
MSTNRTVQTCLLAVIILATILLTGCEATSPTPDDSATSVQENAIGILEPGPYDLVLTGGRVMDPESGTDATLNVGIRDGRVVALTGDALEGNETVDVAGLVVAPGFIDLHAHGQDPVSEPLQAQDGVTTAVDLEAGAFPVTLLHEALDGKAIINFGASVGHPATRVAHFDDQFLGHTATQPPNERTAAADSRFAYAEASDQDIDALLELIDEGLRQGGIGIGMGIVYTPGATRHEVFRIFQHAALRKVPIFVHMRGNDDPGPLGDVQEMLSNAAATGASLHIVHINSSTDTYVKTAMEMIRGAREHGIDVTTEAYPYTAGSTLIQSALFDAWEGLSDEEYKKLEWPATGERLNSVTFAKYRKQGGWVILHTRDEETNAWITNQPDIIVASDGIPFLHGPAHPRGSGTYARVLGRYSRERGELSLMDALSKMTIQPAKRLEAFTPQMKHKGRVSLGADADLAIFDPETVIDRATYGQGDLTSEGIPHVLVAGTFVVRDGQLVEGIYPGQAIKSVVAVDG